MNVLSKNGQNFVSNHGHTFSNYLKEAPPHKRPIFTHYKRGINAEAVKAISYEQMEEQLNECAEKGGRFGSKHYEWPLEA